jgi:hypothetical protein
LYLEAAQTSSKLVEWDIDPMSDEWKKSTKRFWELRWGELELAGGPAIRQAMRRLAQQIVETEYDPKRDRHDLRWMVECLADELRISLEATIGFRQRARACHPAANKAEKSRLLSVGCRN